jgi:hypothetical protein
MAHKIVARELNRVVEESVARSTATEARSCAAYHDLMTTGLWYSDVAISEKVNIR